MKLYILPYQFFEDNIKLNLNIFKREYNLYQNDDTLFLFYNTNQSLLKFNLMYDKFSSNPSDYSIKLDYPTVKLNYFGAYYILSKYENLDVYVISPSNEFIKAEIVYMLNRLKVKEFNIKIENSFDNKSILFFEEYDYRKEKVILPNLIHYMVFLNYLNHMTQMFFMKSTLTVPLNLHKLLIYLNMKKTLLSNRLKGINLLDGSLLLSYRLFHPKMIKTIDNRLYTIANWDDRYLSHKFFEGVMVDIDKYLHTTEDKIDTYEILNVVKSNKIIQETLIDLEFINPQYNISKAIEDIDFFVTDTNDTITEIPSWNIDYDDLYSDLILIKEIFKNYFNSSDENIENLIKQNLEMILDKLKAGYRNSGMPLGICPGCLKGYVWKSNKGFYCDNCQDFTLWNKTLEKDLAFVPTRHQVKTMLNNKDNLIFTIKNNKFKLIQFSNKTENIIWKIAKVK